MARQRPRSETAKRPGKSDWLQGFIKRTKLARERLDLTQEEIAKLLGIGSTPEGGQGTYKNYELNRPLPHEYIPDFLRITGVTYEWLFEEKIRRNRDRRMIVVHSNDQT